MKEGVRFERSLFIYPHRYPLLLSRVRGGGNKKVSKKSSKKVSGNNFITTFVIDCSEKSVSYT